MNDSFHKFQIKPDWLMSKQCSSISKENDVHQFKKRRCTLMSKPSSLEMVTCVKVLQWSLTLKHRKLTSTENIVHWYQNKAHVTCLPMDDEVH